jgi:type IV pilus assembly protein PilP
MMLSANRPLQILVLLAILSMVGCGKEPAPVSKTNVVSKKIAMQGATPAKDKTPSAQVAAKQPTPTKVEENRSPATKKATSSDLVKESLEVANSYNPKGRFDPFEPLFKEEPEAPTAVSVKSKRKRRVPQTPLERVALSQLKLSAVIRAPSGNSALVEDATGKGYVVVKGTYIGLNSGKVIRIEKDRIVIEEEIENVLGELTVQNSELKLQKPAGEL